MPKFEMIRIMQKAPITMINWLAPLDYFYSWTESIVNQKLTNVKEYRTVIVMTYGIGIVLFSSIIAIVSILFKQHNFDIPWFILLIFIAQAISYICLMKIYYRRKRFEKIALLVRKQDSLSRKIYFITASVIIHLYFFLILNFS